jgi:hypothetical protein
LLLLHHLLLLYLLRRRALIAGGWLDLHGTAKAEGGTAEFDSVQRSPGTGLFFE